LLHFTTLVKRATGVRMGSDFAGCGAPFALLNWWIAAMNGRAYERYAPSWSMGEQMVIS